MEVVKRLKGQIEKEVDERERIRREKRGTGNRRERREVAADERRQKRKSRVN